MHGHRIQHMHARVERVRDFIHHHWMVDVLHYECAQKQDTLIGPVKRAVAQRREAIVPQAVAGGGVGDFMPDGEKVKRKKSVLLICALNGDVIKMGAGCETCRVAAMRLLAARHCVMMCLRLMMQLPVWPNK